MGTGLKVRQGTFSTLPDFTDDEIRAQIQYGIDNGWAVAIEYTDDAHPRNVYWDMWGMPMFDLKDSAGGLHEVNRCRDAFPNQYIKVSLYNPKLTKQTIALQFMVQRPKHEPGFRLVRTETNDRHMQYTLESYAARDPHGDRYQDD